VTTSYGSFGTANVGVNFAYGGDKWGNFISANALNTSRFLDPPEFTVMHAKGNEENLFDRVDYQISTGDSIHLNLGYTRSWFQNPNSFDAQNATAWKGLVVANNGLDPNGNPVGPTDQHAQIKTFNIAPSWIRLISANTVLTVGGFVRRDRYDYYPSGNPFADLLPNLQSQSVGQDRLLTNGGIRSTISYVKGIHNVKAGAVYQQTFLDEHDTIGIVDPTFNDPASPNFNPVLAPYDLTRGGRLFTFNGHTDVKLLSLYLQDSITKGNWALNLGLRGDFYNGLSTHKEAEPRIGIAYNIKRSNTVLRASYARILETPFNENLVLSSTGCGNDVLNPLLLCNGAGVTPFAPGWRNDFTPVFSRPSDVTWFSRANTSGSTPTTVMTSPFSDRLPSPFRSSGITPRSPDTPAASACPISMASPRWWSSRAWLRASSSRRSAAPAQLHPPQVACSALTTTRSLIRPRTFNTSPGSVAHG
jgi:hypothetical protein